MQLPWYVAAEVHNPEKAVFEEMTFSGRLLHVNGVVCHEGMLVPTLMAFHDGPSDEPHS
jgi:hypothetical protein